MGVKREEREEVGVYSGGWGHTCKERKERGELIEECGRKEWERRVSEFCLGCRCG